MPFSILNVFFKQRHILHSMPKRPRKVVAKVRLHQKVNEPTPAKKSKTSIPNLHLYFKNMHPNTKVEVLANPVKSANDKKDYKVIRLENGLVACLISDLSNPEALSSNLSDDESESDTDQYESDLETATEESEAESEEGEVEEDDAENERTNRLNKVHEAEEKLAAASLCIGVGSFSDPESIPGLAHFLEHMVFMGSEKYPQENDFDAFLKKRGGSDNASTDCETTTFYFECLEKHLAKALDKFAQFFISPLMKRDAMTREREAIESEFQMALPSDAYRKEQLLASFAQTGSPVNKFLWGNLITLRDNVSDDDLYRDVHEFRKRNYSAHRMTLAIQARLPMDILEAYVLNCFSAVPNNQLPGDDFKKYGDNIFNNSTFKRMYYIKPVKDVCQVDLTWSMPSLLDKYKSKPHQYVSWLLGHEGKGSLLSYLREKLWALGIYTGNGETGLEHNSMYCLFTVTLVLTPEGLERIHEVIEAVFSYINLLKKVGPQERIYNEIKAIEETSFRFKEEENAVDFVEDLAEAMHYYPPEDYITGSNLYFEYNPEGISMVLNKLNPNNLNIMVLSSTLPEEIVYDKTEPWFSTSFAERDIPDQWIEKWSQVEPMDCFSLPAENKFLTTNFDLLSVPDNSVPTYPEKLLDTDLIELWYKPDNKFKLPNAFMHYYFLSSMTQESVVNACMLDLFINILGLLLTEEVYPAHVAELGYSITSSDYGVVVKVDGYNQNLPLLLDLIIKYMCNVSKTTSKELFEAVKDKQAKSYYNTFLKPTKLARSSRLSILMSTYWPPLDKYQAIKNINFEDFKSFSSKFLSQLHVQGLVQGNISKETALDATNGLLNIINCQALPLNELSTIRVRQLPVGKQCIKVMSFNADDSNSIITNYYQVGPGNLKNLATIDILMLIMEEPLFDVLRTKEQLGYNVYCTVCDTYGILGFYITVNAQVNKSTTEHVDRRIDAFVKNMVKNIKKMPDKKINQVKQDLIKCKQLVDVHLKDEVSRNWTEIVQQDFMFDRLPREITAIEEVKISDLRKWLDAYSLDEKRTRKLSIQVVGHTNNEDEKSEIENGPKPREKRATNDDMYRIKYVQNGHDKNTTGYTFISDTEKYKNDLYLFPVHKIQS